MVVFTMAGWQWKILMGELDKVFLLQALNQMTEHFRAILASSWDTTQLEYFNYEGL